mmetsp:Transcript_21914/g.36218  ORF Transcript_21914/g.36218 Transcript_21914/m.36218 type:complete len:404 (+) Transcript_21914:151-1362(+)|eukprot:CAMPEP_0119016406 /NCGR_PEP_ID=MMETSP1176-20130426/12650_1 /TAXON_ID=265551 /ORGANISM="Synedropsis recta cf, Strain CCMP1620" /LENGTH=403 /DNA_ID=CAMNT_0006969799 /DNA_START=48 /DNA_END=1259 /DNA_ORIENTATION=-
MKLLSNLSWQHAAAVSMLVFSVVSPIKTGVSATAVSFGPACFDTITSDTTLDDDLTCVCGNDASALVVVGPAMLDLGGYTVSCSDTNTPDNTFGVEIQGIGATVKNGHVTGAYYGVGGGLNGPVSNSLIKNVRTDFNIYGIFLFFSDGNKITEVSVTDNIVVGILSLGGSDNVISNNHVADTALFEGIAFVGNGNKVIGNTVLNSLEWDCIGISPIDDEFDSFPIGNVIKNNIVSGCGDAGLSVYANNTIVSGNEISDTTRSGILISHTGNKVVDNHIMRAGNDGIGIITGDAVVKGNLIEDTFKDAIDIQPRSGNAEVKGNTIVNCGAEGIQVRSDGNVVKGNVISGCETGIDVIDAKGNNDIKGNVVTGSIFDDLADANVDCGTNKWKGNDGDGNQDCTEE